MTDPLLPPASEPEDASADAARVTRQDVEVRRSPRVWRILALGAGLGAIAAFVATFAFPETPGFSKGQIFGFVLLGFVVIFVALAALLVIVLERVVGRRVRTAQAERRTVGDPAPAATPDPVAQDPAAPAPAAKPDADDAP